MVNRPFVEVYNNQSENFLRRFSSLDHSRKSSWLKWTYISLYWNLRFLFGEVWWNRSWVNRSDHLTHYCTTLQYSTLDVFKHYEKLTIRDIIKIKIVINSGIKPYKQISKSIINQNWNHSFKIKRNDLGWSTVYMYSENQTFTAERNKMNSCTRRPKSWLFLR